MGKPYTVINYTGIRPEYNKNLAEYTITEYQVCISSL